MSNKKISELTGGSPALSTDELPIARSGSSYKLTTSDFFGIPGAFTWDSRKVVVASSDLKSAFSVPIDVYPAVPSATLVLNGRVTIRKLAGTAYTLNGNTTLVLQRGASALLNITLSGFLDQTIERNYNWYGGGGATVLTNSVALSAVGTSLSIKLNVADMVVGSGDLEIALAVEKHQLFYAFST
jgi:hypothetical protein